MRPKILQLAIFFMFAMNIGFFPPNRAHADVLIMDLPTSCPLLDDLLMLKAGRTFSELIGKVQGCEAIKTKGQKARYEGRLSPFWAQELVGADLARNFTESQKDLHRVRFGLLESVDIRAVPEMFLEGESRACVEKMRGKSISLGDPWPTIEEYGEACVDFATEALNGSHGTPVVNLVLHPQTGAGAAVDLVFSRADNKLIHSLTVDPGESHDAASKRREQAEVTALREQGVELLCSSLGTGGKSEVYANHMKYSGIRYFQSAGNEFPNPASSLSYGIFVGSLAPTGLASGYSSPGQVVAVYAPSEHDILSIYGSKEGKPEFDSFGGTSGAQPLACGSGANAISIIPDITQDELLKLVELTAVPILGRISPHNQDNAGMINAYRLARAAKLLKEGGAQARKDLLAGTWKPDFTEDARHHFDVSKRLFTTTNECYQNDAFDELRKAFLLDPENPIYLNALADFYERKGYSLNAEFLRNTMGISTERLIELTKDPHEDVRASAYRELIGRKDPRIKAALRSGLVDDKLYPAVIAAIGLRDRGEERAVLDVYLDHYKKRLLIADVKDRNSKLDILTAEAWYRIKLPRKEFVELCLTSPQPVQFACAGEAPVLGGKYLDLLLQNADRVDFKGRYLPFFISRLEAKGDVGLAVLKKAMLSPHLTAAEKGEFADAIARMDPTESVP